MIELYITFRGGWWQYDLKLGRASAVVDSNLFDMRGRYRDVRGFAKSLRSACRWAFQ